jgi:hypothetical protein
MWDVGFRIAERYKAQIPRHKAQERSLGSQAELAPKGHFATKIVSSLLPTASCQLPAIFPHAPCAMLLAYLY